MVLAPRRCAATNILQWRGIQQPPNPAGSLAFIKYAVEPKVLAGIAKYIPYGPVRKSAAEFVAPEDAKNLPTSPQNLTVSLTLDNAFWADNDEACAVAGIEAAGFVADGG